MSVGKTGGVQRMSSVRDIPGDSQEVSVYVVLLVQEIAMWGYNWAGCQGIGKRWSKEWTRSSKSVRCKGKVGCHQTPEEWATRCFLDFLTLKWQWRCHGSAAIYSQSPPGCLRDSSSTGNDSLSLPFLKIIFLFISNIQAQELWLTSLGLMWWKSIFTLNGLFQITGMYLIRLHYALRSILAYKKRRLSSRFWQPLFGSLSPWNTVTTRRDKLKINECAVLDVFQSRIFT